MPRIFKSAGLTAGLASLVLLSACATPTPYQPIDAAQSTARGYSDTRIETGRYRLRFSGNTSTPRETVENYMLFRASELTIEQGYDWFTLVSPNTQETTTVSRSYRDPFGPSYYGGFYWRYYRGGWGSWGAYQESSTTFHRYEATAEVVMGRGAKPEGDLHSYNAREVAQNLAPQIVRPQPK
ncbi:MAG: hypothetical protein QM645_07830 [Asticcacaulis sp.]